MNYANRKNIPFVLMIGSKEIESQLFSLKNMNTGEQKELDLKNIIEELK